MTFSFPGLATSSGFNKLLPKYGGHTELATGTRGSSTTNFTVKLDYFKEDYTGTDPSSTDRAIFYAKWNYKAGNNWKVASKEIWLKKETKGSTPYTQGGKDYNCMASTSWFNINRYRIKGTVWF